MKTAADQCGIRRYQQVLELENGSDDGDEYDYSPARDEWLLTSGNLVAGVSYQHQPWR
ncbi:MULTISPECIES: hypothetical protein [Rahnella]|uniref:Uncharacterized protein n=1 Tax=Rahnella sp. (strain Y9602) TaxID=2703885 RepID=A0ABW6C4N5_RAHSY|nr:alpha-mannosidase [Rahnella aquatilis HX2]MBU9839552.1 hypothetical protein [Rahnella aceris]MBU9859965.1 hypothetical protein [Rahnella aceris]MBU9865861.1 hypothetical protein [Rahnella aceris]MDP9707098.1 mannosylglycerate hydrolase [Rahnella aquatilis]